MTGNNPDYFATSSTNIQDFSSKLVKAFKAAATPITDQVNIAAVSGVLPTGYEIFKKNANGSYTKITPGAQSEISGQNITLDMQGLTPASYKIVYKLSEDQFESEDFKPISLTMTFEGKEETIGTDTDGNIPSIPKNTRSDCEINISKYVANDKEDYENRHKYKELVYRRQEFFFDSAYNFTSKVLDAKTSLLMSDKIDSRLDVLDAYIVAGNDLAKTDAVSGATPNQTLIAELKGSIYGNNDHTGVPGIIFDQAENQLSFLLPQQPTTIGGTNYLFGGYVGKDYVFVIKVKIKDTVTDEQIREMRTTIDPEDRKPVGVPNVSKIQIDDTPEVLSNKARAVPPAFLQPTIKKYVSGETENIWYPEYNELSTKEENYRYRIELEMPHDLTTYTELRIVDRLDAALVVTNIDDLSAYYIDKASVKTKLDRERYTVSYDSNNEIRVTLNESLGATHHLFENMADKKLYVEFPVKVKEGADLASKYNAGLNRIEIPNGSHFAVNDYPETFSNEVKTIVPMPKLELTKVEAGSTTGLPEAEFTLQNTTENINIANRIFVSDSEGKVSVDKLVPGHSYTLTESKAPIGYMLDETNKWTITVANDGTITLSDGPDGSAVDGAIVAPNTKPTAPTPEKWLKGASQIEFSQPTEAAPYVLPNNGETITYQVRVPITDVNGYERLQITDEIVPSLSPVPETLKAFLLDDPATSISSSLVIQDRTMTFTKTTDLESLVGEVLVIEFQATVDSDLNGVLEKHPDGKIPNTASLKLNAQDPVVSNEVVIQVTRGKVRLNKTISDSDGTNPAALPQSLSAGFALYKVVGSADPESSETDDIRFGTYTVAGPNDVEIGNLNPGMYYFLETSPPEGYVKHGGMIPTDGFTIDATGGDITIPSITVNNLKSENPTIKKMVKGVNRPEYSDETYGIGIGEEWTYAIDVHIPASAAETVYTIADEIPQSFEIRGIKVFAKEAADPAWPTEEDPVAKGYLAPFNYSNPNQIKLNIPADGVEDYRAKIIRIEVKVRVKPGTNLLTAGVLQSDGTIPNTATLTFNTTTLDSSVSIKPVLLRNFSFDKMLGNTKLGGALFELKEVNPDGSVGDPVIEPFTGTPGSPYSETSNFYGKVTFKNVPSGQYWMVETPPVGKLPQFGKIKVIVGEINAAKPIAFFNESGIEISSAQVFNNELIQVKGLKTWVDNNNDLQTRPESIEVSLWRKIGENGQPELVEKKTVTSPWNYEFKDEEGSYKLLKFDPFSNQEYVYYVTETPVPNYSTEINGYDITNTLEEITFRIIKRDGDKKAAGIPNPEIIGTTFILEHPNGVKQEVVSGELGIIEFPGVKKGVTYRLYEKQTDFSDAYIFNSGIVIVEIDANGKPRFTPDKFPLIDPDNDTGTDNSGYEFLNYLEPIPVKRIKVGKELLDHYDLNEYHEVVTYQIRVPVQGIGDINALEIVDTVDSSMQVVSGSAKVYADDTDISEIFQKSTSNLNRTQSFKIDRVSGNIGQIENKTLTFEFQAKLVLGPSALVTMHPDLTVPNKAMMTINSRPENQVETNTVTFTTQLTDLRLTKKLEIQGGDPIHLAPGETANFELTKPGYELFAPRVYTAGSEELTIPDLNVGKYILTETKVPEGYLPIEPIYFEVKNEEGVLKVYKTNSEWEEPVLIENNNLGDIVDPLPAQPTLNKMVKAKDADMTEDGGDYKHYDMTTWKDKVDFVVDINIPENITGYERLYFGDVLPLGLDVIGDTAVMQVGQGEGAAFVAEGDQDPFVELTPVITQTTDTQQYLVEAEASSSELIPKLAGKTIRITTPAAISDKFDSISQLTLDQGNFKNTAWIYVNNEIVEESFATVKPVDQFGLVLRKIADFASNGADVPLYEAVFLLSQYVVLDGEGNPIESETGPAIPEGMNTSFETGDDGYIRIPSRLEPGKYILTEGKYPAGYVIDNKQHPARFVAMHDRFLLEVGVAIPGGGKGVRVSALDDPSILLYEGPMPTEENPAKIMNRQIVYMPVNKVWVDDNNEQNLRPETIELLIQRSIVVGEPDVLDPATGLLVPSEGDDPDTLDTAFNEMAKNDTSGRLNATVNIGNLPNFFAHESLFRYSPDGALYNYYVLETPPKGYTATYKAIPTNPAFGEYATAESVEITNTLRKTSNFTLLKQDDSDPVENVEGAVFNLSFTDRFGRNIVVTKTSDPEGRIDLSGLVANTTYILKEIKAPAGYQIDPKEYAIVVDADGIPKVQVGGEDLSAPQFTVTPETETTPTSYQLIITDTKLDVADPVKKINGENSLNLSTLSQVFEYTVDVPVTSVEGMTSFVLEDTVHDLLEIVAGSATVKADGVDVGTAENLTVDGKKVTFSLTSDFDKIANRTVRLSFKAKIADGVTMQQLKTFMEDPENNAGIPNTATLKINDKSSTSNTVYLVAGEPGAIPRLDKKVNGADHYDLVENSEVFRYVITAQVPENVLGYDTLVIRDILSKILQVDGGVVLRAVEYNANGTETSSVTLVEGTDYVLINTSNTDPNASEDGEIEATFINFDFTKVAGKTIVMEFDARIKSGVTAEQIVAFQPIKVPNTAQIDLNGSKVKEKIVTITPTSELTLDKKVNGLDDVTLDGAGLADTIRYTVEMKVPYQVEGMDTLVISDELSEVLVYVGATVEVDENTDTDNHIVVNKENNGPVTATITGNENITKYAGKTIRLTITANVDQTKDLSDYLVEGKLPNTAEVNINDQPKVSDTAKITPALGAVQITKELENEDSNWPTGEKAVFKLEKRVGTDWSLVESIEIDGFSPVHIGNLLPGTYRLTETSAPAEYLLADPQEFTITGSETVVQTLEFTDTKVPGITKAVDQGYFGNFAEERTVTISVPIGSVEGMNKLVITDELDAMFQIVANTASATADGTALPVQPVVNGQTVTFTMTDNLAAVANKTIELTFRVKLKDGFVYSELPAEYKENGIPNQAKLVINDGTPVESEVVRVKVPVGEVTLTKTADGEPLPSGTVATFKLYQGTPGSGTEIGEYTTAKNGLGNDIVRVGDLAPGSYYFIETVAPQGYVLNATPRVFTVAVDNGLAQTTAGDNFDNFTVDNTKSEIPTPVKKVNDADHVDLTTFDQTFSYTVTVPVTKVDGWTEFTLTDQVDASLEVSNIKVTIDEAEYTPGAVDGGTFTVENNLITFRFTQLDKVQALVDKEVVLTFNAKLNVKPEEFLATHPDSIVRNTANLGVGVLTSTSNEVTVTPPAEVPTPVKSINGDASETPLKLGEKDQKFFYDVRVQIPANVTGYNKLVLSDGLAPVLKTSPEQIRVYVNDIRNEALKKYVAWDADTNVAALTIDSETPDPDFDFAELAGKTLRLEIEAGFKSDVTAEQLAPYTTNGVVTVPNQAQFTLNSQAPKDSNTVYVTRPGDEPTVEKTVDNNGEGILLGTKAQEFTYRVKVNVPANVEGYNDLTLEDTLEDVLEVESTDVLVETTSDAGLNAKVATDGNKISLAITEGFTEYAGKSITLVIQAKIKDSVTLDQIAHRYGNSAIPNAATLHFNGSPKNSNTVIVTPPSDIAAPVKTVNAQNDIVLNNIRDEFVYNISYKIPTNITGFNALVLTDVLEEVLQTEKAKILVYVDEQVDNKLTEAISVTGAGPQTVSLTINKGFLGGIFGNAFEDLAGKTIRVEIKATIRDGADLSGYTDAKVPNTARLQLNDNAAKDSNTVTVQPPKGNVILTKVVDGEPLSGDQTATFKLYKQAGTEPNPGTDTLVQIQGADEATVDATNNQLTVSGLEPGNYYFVETDAPAGYTLNNTPIRFTITANQSIALALTWNNVSDLTPVKTVNDAKSIDIRDFSQEFTYKVSVPVGSVSAIQKLVIQDEVNGLLSIVNDSGKVYKQDGTAVAGDITVNGNTITFTKTSDFAGMTNSLVTLEFKAKLKDGITVEELKTEDIFLTTGISNAATLSVNDKAAVASDTVNVRPILGDVELGKTVNYLALEAGQSAKFDLFKGTAPNGEKVGDTWTTDANGKIAVTDLIPGSYYFVEVEAPAGYKLDTTSKAFTIFGGEKLGSNPVSVLVNNEPAELPTPSKSVDDGVELQLSSLDQEFTYKVEVPVAEVNGINSFKIQDVVDTLLTITKDSAKVTIGNDAATGTVQVDGQTITYTASEADIASMTGRTVTLEFKAKIKEETTAEDLRAVYADLKIPNKAALTVNENAEAQTNTVTVQPQFGGVVLTKTIDDGQPLPKDVTATFELYRVTSTGDVLIKEYTTVNGRIEVYDLAPGDYKFVETTAPVGYEKAADTAFTIIAGEATKQLTVDNLPIATSVTVEKEWVHGPDNKPEVQVQLFRQVTGGNKEFVGEAVKLNATNNWTHTWNDLDKTNANGQDYIYTVDEIEVPAGYSKTIETVEGATNSFKITNTFGVTTGDITAYKKWVGGDSLERPTDIYFQLVKDGVNEGDAKALGSATEVTWADQPLVKADGTPITYTVKEVDSEGNDWTNDSYDVSYDGLVVTNTYKTTKITAKVVKEYVGGTDASHVEVDVQLFRQIAGENKEFVGEAVRLNADNNWTGTWSDLEKTNANGQDYIYSVDELNVPAGYSKAIDTVAGETNSFKITNTFGITTGDITAYKKWVSGDSLERPTDIYFQLVKDGVNEGDAKALGSATEITWADQPLVKADGTSIAYTVKEARKMEVIGSTTTMTSPTTDSLSPTPTKP